MRYYDEYDDLRNDDDDDEEFYDDEDEVVDDEDEEEGGPPARVNPFAPRTSGLPGSRPGGSNPPGGGSAFGTGSRPPAPGSSNTPPRPGTPGGGSSTFGSGSRPPTPGGGSNPPGGGSSTFGPRPGTPGGGNSPGGGGSTFGSGSRPPAPGGGNPPGGSGSTFGSGSRPPAPGGGSNPPGGSGSRPPAPGGGGSGPTPFTGTKPPGSTGPSPTPPRPGAPPAGGSGPAGSNAPKPASPAFGDKKPEDKKDDKPASGGGLGGKIGGLAGGLGGRFGGGDKKDDKPADKKPEAKKDDKPGGGIGGALGGLGGRFGGGDKKDDKPADKKPEAKKDEGGGGLGGKLGGLAGGLTSRLPIGGGDKKDDAKPAASAAPKPVGAPGGASPFGGAKPGGGSTPPAGGAKPGAAPAASAPAGGRKLFGALGGSGAAAAPGKAAPAKKAGAEQGGLGRFMPSFLKGGEADKKTSARPKTSKAPKVQSEGLSLDNKLDILGVGLVLGSLALLFSSLSTTKGQLTGAINKFLGESLGWGAIAIPLAMLLVGVWLIARHFGEEAPVIPTMRIVGSVVLYVGLLVAFQFVDSFSYKDATLASLKNVWLEISWRRQSGGGMLGGQLYYLLVANFTDVGSFFIIIAWLIVGVMITFSISAAEMTIFIISAVRSFKDAVQRRAHARATQRAALAAQQAAALAQLTVTKPEAAPLPAPAAPALPATATAEAAPALPEPVRQPERAIPITIGGRTVTAFTGGDKVPVENTPPALQPAGGPPRPGSVPPADKPANQPAAGGIGARLRGALPAGKPAEPEKPATNAGDGDKQAGGLRGLFNRSAAEPKPAAPPAAPPTPTAAPAMSAAAPADAPARPPMATPAPDATLTPKPAAASAAPPASAPERTSPFSRPPAPEEEPVRLSDLMPKAPEKPAANAGGGTSPFARPTGFQRPGSEPPKPADKPVLSPAPERPAPQPVSDIPASAPPADKPAAPVMSPVEKPAAEVKTPAETPEEKPAAVVGARPVTAEPPKPPTAKPSTRPPWEDLDDEDEEDFEDDFEDDEEEADEGLTNLPPARPRGVGPAPRPESRFAPRAFGTPAPGPNRSPLAERQDRLNAIRSGNNQPPEDDKADEKPTAPVEKPAATIQGTATPVGPRPFGASPDKPADGGSKPPVSPPRPFGAPPSSAAPTSPASDKPATDGNGKPPVPGSPRPFGAPGAQPAAAFWKSPSESQTAKPGGTTNGDGKPAEPARPAPPPAQQPAAQADGKPSYYGPPTTPPVAPARAPAPAAADGERPTVPQPPTVTSTKKRKDWKLPDPATLLRPGSDQEFDQNVLLQKAHLIEETLQSFGAPGKVVEVNTGPVITQFGVEPDYLTARGGKKNRVKVSAIAQLDKDLQLALGAKSIRVEAPVPGKGYVGIEVPNDKPAVVSLRDVMDAEEYQKIKSPLTIALGQSVDGTPVAADLSSMPHLLIAGTTGSGKSVLVNAIITSLILRNTPDKLKFIMVDPKRVELTGYNGIPHLVAPVVVELERIVGVLKWVTREMDERYKKFSNAGARNIEDYNNHLKPEEERMPYIVVIIDELADLMMMAPDETERVITRIAALARATGIHLVIATQRPSVDVVTGLIKANFPARVAFAVASGVDSKVILDQPGADRLLGRGDMLFMSGDSPAPVRLQGVYVSDTEINNITRYWRTQMTEEDLAAKPISALVLDNSVVEAPRAINPNADRSQAQQAFWDREKPSASSVSSTGIGEEDIDPHEDELYEEAVEMVRRLNRASVSLLQRRLRIGYTRAARLIDLMEEEGIIGPATDNSKPREVLPLKG
jgi:S-DNA-T family DNA segregation ATPase FtsK/SpoIIIE